MSWSLGLIITIFVGFIIGMITYKVSSSLTAALGATVLGSVACTILLKKKTM